MAQPSVPRNLLPGGSETISGGFPGSLARSVLPGDDTGLANFQEAMTCFHDRFGKKINLNTRDRGL